MDTNYFVESFLKELEKTAIDKEDLKFLLTGAGLVGGGITTKILLGKQFRKYLKNRKLSKGQKAGLIGTGIGSGLILSVGMKALLDRMGKF